MLVNTVYISTLEWQAWMHVRGIQVNEWVYDIQIVGALVLLLHDGLAMS